MTTITERAREYLEHNAAESGADVLILDLIAEVETLRAIIRKYDPDKLRHVNCEECGGSGEIIRIKPGKTDPAYEYAEPCRACEGGGRDLSWTREERKS